MPREFILFARALRWIKPPPPKSPFSTPAPGPPSSAQLGNIQISLNAFPIQAQVFVTGQAGQPGQQQVPPGGAVYITAGVAVGNPIMPQLSAKLTGSGLNGSALVYWQLTIQYSRPRGGVQLSCAPPGVATPSVDCVVVTSGPVAASTPFAPQYGGAFQGGSATLYWTYFGTTPPTGGQFYFTVGGDNPLPSQIYNFLFPYLGATWFFSQMVWQESITYVQFLDNGTPIFGADQQNPQSHGGFGLMQLTNPVPTSADIWNWQQNIDDGNALLADYQFDEYAVWARQIAQWKAWNANPNHQNQQVSLPNDRTDGGCTFTASAVSSPKHGYEDALWIQRYNSQYRYYEYFLNGSWVYYGSSYVTGVCNKSSLPPQP